MTCINWRGRILDRLAGTKPSHDAAHSRIAGVSSKYDAMFREMYPDTAVPAAVLVPIIERESGCTVLLTVRATGMRRHAGQIAFPGGRIEDTDADPAAAAQREAWEEIGLPSEHCTVVGYLPDHLVFTGYRVTPVVALVRPGFTLKYDPGEVADSFEVPVSHLFDPVNHGFRKGSVRGRAIELHEIPFQNRAVWGATAGMLINLYQVVCGEADAA
ncbi:MAG: CoA pyrophosphatase [Steroidobacteraceae bacterium]